MNRRTLNFGVIVLFTVSMIFTLCSKKDSGEDTPIVPGIALTPLAGIKGMKTTVYEAIADGKGGAKKTEKKRITIDTYDTWGRPLEERSIEIVDGKERLSSRYVYTYDERGLLKGSVSYDYDIFSETENEKKDSETMYMYDNEGRLIEMIDTYLDDIDSPDGKKAVKQVHQYEGDKLIETKSYVNDVYSGKIIYTYDGNLSEVKKYDENDNYTGKISSLSDDKGNELKYSIYDENDNLQSQFVYEYNDKGDLIHSKGDNNEVTYKYKYNDRNHWVEQIYFNTYSFLGSTTEEVSVTEREIEYY